MPIVRASCAERRALVTWPAGRPFVSSTTAPSVGSSPSVVKPTSRTSGSCLATCSSAQRPMKACGLSNLTIQSIPAPYGVDLRIRVLPDEDVLLLQAQHALRLEPERPRSRRGERVPDVPGLDRGAVELVAELADEADAQEQARHAGDARVAGVEVRERLGRAVELGQAREDVARPRAGRFMAATPWVTSVTWASSPQLSSHHVKRRLDRRRARRGGGHVERLVVDPADRPVVGDPPGLGDEDAVADAARTRGSRSGSGRAGRAARRRPARGPAACRASRRRSAPRTRARRAPRPRGRRSRRPLPVARPPDRGAERRVAGVQRRPLGRLDRPPGQDAQRHRGPRRPRRGEADGCRGRGPVSDASTRAAGTCEKRPCDGPMVTVV